jgi:hypothetical protein
MIMIPGRKSRSRLDRGPLYPQALIFPQVQALLRLTANFAAHVLTT